MKNLFEIEHNYMSIPNKVIAEDMIEREIDNVKEFIRHMVKRQDSYVVFLNTKFSLKTFIDRLAFEKITSVNDVELAKIKMALRNHKIEVYYESNFKFICYLKNYQKYFDLLNFLIKKLDKDAKSKLHTN